MLMYAEGKTSLESTSTAENSQCSYKQFLHFFKALNRKDSNLFKAILQSSCDVKGTKSKDGKLPQDKAMV
jgi:hypothetical protein